MPDGCIPDDADYVLSTVNISFCPWTGLDCYYVVMLCFECFVEIQRKKTPTGEPFIHTTDGTHAAGAGAGAALR